MLIDLHLHSTASDGLLSPSALMEQCHAKGLSCVALTDHDTLAGVKEAMEAASLFGMHMIPGVELSTDDPQELHILGYGIKDIDSMERVLSRMREARRKRLYTICEKLRAAGIGLDPEKIEADAGSTVGRPHVARALLEAGYVSSVKEAFSRFLAPGKCGYAAREKLDSAEAIRIIHASGGIAVLAHPSISIRNSFTLPERVKALRLARLDGLEAHHLRHTPAQRRSLDRLARSMGLYVTGGSDYHGGDESLLAAGMENWTEKEKDYRRLIRAIGAKFPEEHT
ncbi:MAG: PHP domain-containing protein [Christensenellales bacterium]|jgi:predicted metal-dependent phosphoesterase TrpH